MHNTYLEVKFHDNDFTSSLLEALHTLWTILHDENIFYELNRPHIKEILKRLHKNKVLIPLIRRLWVSETLKREASQYTRMSYGGGTSYCLDDLNSSPADKVDKYHTYLDFSISFHTNDKFIKDRNAEHGYINLDTGDIKIF